MSTITKYKINHWADSEQLDTYVENWNFSTIIIKVFCFNYKGIKKIKNFQKFSNKETYFTLQNNNENYSRPLKFVSWTSHTDGNPVFTPKTWGKIFTNWFKKCSDGYIFSMWYKLNSLFLTFKPCDTQQRMENTPTILCPRCKESKVSHPILYSTVNCPKIP